MKKLRKGLKNKKLNFKITQNNWFGNGIFEQKKGLISKKGLIL